MTGPITPISSGGYYYIFTLIDAHTRYVTTYLLKHKSEATYYIIKYANQFRTKFNRNFKILRTDGGTEFFNSAVNQYCHEQGIIQQQTIRHSSHQNGIAERMFYTLLDSVRAMLYSSDLPRIHWDSAVRYATSTRNLCPTSSTSVIPHQAWHGTDPDYESLRPFGSPCVYHVDRVDRQYHQLDGSSKLVRGQTAHFLGFAPSAKGYLLLLPDNSTITVRYEQVTFTPETQITSQHPPVNTSTNPSPSPYSTATNHPAAPTEAESTDSSQDSTTSTHSDSESDDSLPTTALP